MAVVESSCFEILTSNMDQGDDVLYLRLREIIGQSENVAAENNQVEAGKELKLDQAAENDDQKCR